MNKGKEIIPYRYSNALILILLAVKEYFGLPYRQTEGFAKMLSGMWNAKISSYSPHDAEEAWNSN